MGGWGRVERPDAEIWYFDSGPEIGSAESDDRGTDLPVVVLLHGLAGHAMEWRTTIDALDDDHRVVAIEQRGHGSSTRRPDDVSRDAHVADVLAVLDDLAVGAVPLVGHSMGAQTALRVARAAPERVLSLVMVEAGLGGEPPASTAAVTDWLASWPAPFVDEEEFVTFFGGDPTVAHAWASSLEQRPDGLWPAWDAATLGRTLAAVHADDLLDVWAQVHVPTLLVRGEHGSLHDRQVDAMRAVRPEVSVSTVAGVGHDVHLQAPETWIRVLRAWLAEHP